MAAESWSFNRRPIVFTDLDGTLLDHHTYAFEAAKPALAALAKRDIPVIINSSKTCAEILPLQERLGIRQPFISENGAAVYLPTEQGWHCERFAEPRERVLKALNDLRRLYHFIFTGFADASVEGIAAMTGLSFAEASLAGQRDFSEPLLWQGDQTSKQLFISLLAEQGLQAMQGGRFLTVCGDQAFDKGLAMQWLCAHLAKPEMPAWLTIGLGDSPNDFPMLAKADVAILVRSDRPRDIRFEQAQLFIYTEEHGPAGWQSAMDEVIPWLDTIND